MRHGFRTVVLWIPGLFLGRTISLFGPQPHRPLRTETDIRDAGSSHNVQRLITMLADIVFPISVELNQAVIQFVSNSFLGFLSDNINAVCPW